MGPRNTGAMGVVSPASPGNWASLSQDCATSDGKSLPGTGETLRIASPSEAWERCIPVGDGLCAICFATPPDEV